MIIRICTVCLDKIDLQRKYIQYVLEIAYVIGTLYQNLLRGADVKMVGRFVSFADPESSVLGGPTLTTFFMRGERIQIALKDDHYRPASETPFKWCFASGVGPQNAPLHNMLLLVAYCVPCIHNMLRWSILCTLHTQYATRGAYCVGSVHILTHTSNAKCFRRIISF